MSLIRHGCLRRLHHGLDDVCADFLPHLAASEGGEAVVKARADPGVGDLIAESPKANKVMRDTG
jgi:hypothetical protein